MIRRERLPQDIEERLLRLAGLLAGDDRVVFCYLFGGLAQGRQVPLSDVDLAVYCDTSPDAGYRLELYERIVTCLGTDEVDLVALNTAPLSLAGRILKNRLILVDKRPPIRHAYESRVMREFFDFAKKEQVMLAGRFAHG